MKQSSSEIISLQKIFFVKLLTTNFTKKLQQWYVFKIFQVDFLYNSLHRTQCGIYYYDKKRVISGQDVVSAKTWQKYAIFIEVELKVPLKKKSVSMKFDLFLEK